MSRGDLTLLALALALGAGCASVAGLDGSADAGPGGGVEGGDAGPVPEEKAFTRYAADTARSPVTRSVAARLREVRAGSSAPNDLVFMKVGASGTVSPRFLTCLSGDDIDLAGRDALQATIDHYNEPEAAGSTSYARVSLAAKSGRSAGWAISGDPSPLAQEIAAISPRVALVNYGTNDMGLGSTYESALWPFHENFSTLLDQLESQAIIPIITGLNPRADSLAAARWVPTYNAVTRAIAEARQLPYINLYLASVGLPDMGLVNDGIHGNVYVDGTARPCAFTAEGLEYNYNVRNLLTVEALDDVRRAAILGEDPAATPPRPYQGSGAPDDPWVIDELPFSHHGSTLTSPHSLIDAYPACDAGQDESGPERTYRLDLTETTPLRILVLDRGDTDVDLHLLAGAPDPSACVARAHRIIERTLAPGTYFVVVDTFVGADGRARAGDYSLVVLACEDGDPRCA